MVALLIYSSFCDDSMFLMSTNVCEDGSAPHRVELRLLQQDKNGPQSVIEIEVDGKVRAKLPADILSKREFEALTKAMNPVQFK